MTASDLAVGEQLIRNVFRIYPLIISGTLTLIIGIYMLFSYLDTGNRASFIFCWLCAAFIAAIGWMLVYSWRTRPILLRDLGDSLNREKRIVFTDEGIAIHTANTSDRYRTEEMLGQFWYNDYYALYLKNKEQKQLIIIPITANNVDQLNTVIQFYHARKKRLSKLKTR